MLYPNQLTLVKDISMFRKLNVVLKSAPTIWTYLSLLPPSHKGTLVYLFIARSGHVQNLKKNNDSYILE